MIILKKQSRNAESQCLHISSLQIFRELRFHNWEYKFNENLSNNKNNLADIWDVHSERANCLENKFAISVLKY